MHQYRISNRISGWILDLGTYASETPQGALDAMAQDAGYRDYAHACEVTGDDGSDLIVEELEPCHDDDDSDLVTVEIMPEHLRENHRAARNWGWYPANGAQRIEVTAEEAEDIIAADPDGYAHVID